MKALLVTYYTPNIENKRGISALIYSYLKYRPKNIDIYIISFNANELSLKEISHIEQELSAKITITKLPKLNLLIKNHSFLRYASLLISHPASYLIHPTKEIVDYVNKHKLDVMITYTTDISGIPLRINNVKQIILGPDSPFLSQKRYPDSGCLKDIFRKLIFQRRYNQAKHLESSIAQSGIKLLCVGRYDVESFKNLFPRAHTVYVPHPYIHVYTHKISFNGPKLRVLIAGQYDIWMKRGADQLIDEMAKHANVLNDKVEITFLGKQWEPKKTQLQEAKYSSHIINWVDNYNNELIKYDIQLVPISYGTGTKGKVLEAMANGLLCIGTFYAMENICEDNEGGYMYKKASEVPQILQDCYFHRKRYEQMAEKGRDRILKEHNPILCAHFFWNEVIN